VMSSARQCTGRILRASPPSFWRNEGSPCYPIHPTPLIFHWMTFLFPKLKIATKGTRFEFVSAIPQTVTRELKVTREEAFSRAFDSMYEQCKRCAEAGGDYIECGINKYFSCFCVVFMASVRELNCHTVY
jgi:hypothetical protein